MNSPVARGDQAAAGFSERQNTKRRLILSTGKTFLLENRTPEYPDRAPAIGNAQVCTVAGVKRWNCLKKHCLTLLAVAQAATFLLSNGTRFVAGLICIDEIEASVRNWRSDGNQQSAMFCVWL